MRTALALVVVLAAGPAWAAPSVKQLLAAEAQANSRCRDTYNEATTPEACSRRDRLFGRLTQAGWCYGRVGQIQAQKEWHPCRPDSIRTDDLKPD